MTVAASHGELGYLDLDRLDCRELLLPGSGIEGADEKNSVAIASRSSYVRRPQPRPFTDPRRCAAIARPS
ncbi:hypothetical protein SBADM41S_06858 [Streptomyces badius]